MGTQAETRPRAGAVVARDRWSGPAAETVLLDFDTRNRRRLMLRGLNGLEFLLDLPRPAALQDGDALRLDDGRLIAVRAAPEPLLRVSGATDLTRVAWHLGNRHLPTEITPEALFIRQDHVIEAMLRGLGAETERVSRPFQPERGAYDEGHAHHHGEEAGRG